MRPKSIVLFDRLFLASLALGLLGIGLNWDREVAKFTTHPAAAEFGFGAGTYMVVIGLVVAVSLLLWYSIAWRASNLAKWTLFVLVAVGIVMIGLAPGKMSNPSNSLTLIGTLVQVAAIVFLFRADARAWFARDTDGFEGPDVPPQ